MTHARIDTKQWDRRAAQIALNTIIEICKIADVRLKNQIPEPEEVINHKRLFD
jgi:hypothetical protein